MTLLAAYDIGRGPGDIWPSIQVEQHLKSPKEYSAGTTRTTRFDDEKLVGVSRILMARRRGRVAGAVANKTPATLPSKFWPIPTCIRRHDSHRAPLFPAPQNNRLAVAERRLTNCGLSGAITPTGWSFRVA